jgi:hypothetical protein
MLLFIPSRSRAGEVKTLGMVPKGQAILAVPEHQVEAYSPEADAHGAEILSCRNALIAEKRLLIGLEAKRRGAEKFVMLDDDLVFNRRISKDGWKLRVGTPEDVTEMLGMIDAYLDDYALVSVSPRQLNNTLPYPGVENTRCMRVLGFRTDDFLSVQHCRVPVMEDFDVALQLLEQGKKNYQLSEWAAGQASTQEPGGCGDFRTHEMQEAAAIELFKLHPGVVSVVPKSNKHGGEFGSRAEVRVYWEKAYAIGAAKNAAASAAA